MIAEEISLRPVLTDDKRMIFKWRNTPFLINLGSSEKVITWEEHCSWFNSIFDKKNIVLFIINLDATLIGQLRFDLMGDSAYKVSIYLLEEYTGRGIGAIVLQRGLELMKREKSNRKFIAFIKKDNRASRSVFLKAGFDDIRDLRDTPPGHIAMICSPGKTLS